MKRVFLLLILSILAISLSGCGTMQRLLKDSGKQSVSGLLNNTASSGTSAPALGETRSVTVYFADGTGKSLVAQEIQIAKTVSLARETLNELLKGPGTGSGMQSVIPKGTTLLDINIKDETAIVDLSKEIQKSVSNVSSELTVYAIVNTLTQFPTIKQVKFRVDGQPVLKIGSVNVGQGIARNAESVKKHPITQKPVSGGTSSFTPSGT